jgi:tetratricopeptide (TPR) repeat protein
VDDFRSKPIFRCVLAQMAVELGYEAEARGTLEVLAADALAMLPFDEDWLVSASLLAETAVSLTDAPHTLPLYERLAPYHDRVAVSYSEVSMGAVSRYLGLLASTTGRRDDAARHFKDALAMNERIGARPWLAHTQEDYGRMLLERGEMERASELIAAALATYRELGMESHAARAAAAAMAR